MYAFVEAEKVNYPIALLCRVLGLSQSAFYASRTPKVTARQERDARLRLKIERLFTAHKKRYGRPRIVPALRNEGECVGPHRVRRLMNELGLQAKTYRKRVRTTHGCAANQASPHLVERNFNATSPGQLWVSDLTYLRTHQGFWYLCTGLDMATRQVVGWSMSDSLASSIALDALHMACTKQPPMSNAIFHSDRGVQYTSGVFRQRLAQLGMQQSMSRKGNGWDNAPAESFFATLKREAFEQPTLNNHNEARQQIFEYIEGYYHSKRAHSALNYQTPNQAAQRFDSRRAA